MRLGRTYVRNQYKRNVVVSVKVCVHATESGPPSIGASVYVVVRIIQCERPLLQSQYKPFCVFERVEKVDTSMTQFCFGGMSSDGVRGSDLWHLSNHIESYRIESNRIELYRIVLRSWSRRICEVCWQLFQQNVFVCVLKSTTRLEKIFENKWAYSVDDWLVVIGESRKVFVDSARTHDKNKFGHEQSNDSHVSYVQFPIVRYSGEFWRFADKHSPRYERVILVRPRDTRDATCYRHEKTGIRKKDALLSQHGIRRLQRYRSSCQGATTRGIR